MGLEYESSINAAGIWTLVSFILAICGAFVLYFTFLSKDNDNKYPGFLGWLYDFLTFKTLTLETILKVAYLFVAIFITLGSLSLIGINFLSFILTLVLGNLLARVAFEGCLIILLMYRQLVKIGNKK